MGRTLTRGCAARRWSSLAPALEFTHAALSAWLVGVDAARETATEDDDEAGGPGDASRTAGLRLDEALLRELARLVDERDAAGPRFFCGDLVDGACEQQCDWERAFAERHDFACYGTLSHARSARGLLAWAAR